MFKLETFFITVLNALLLVIARHGDEDIACHGDEDIKFIVHCVMVCECLHFRRVWSFPSYFSRKWEYGVLYLLDLSLLVNFRTNLFKNLNLYCLLNSTSDQPCRRSAAAREQRFFCRCGWSPKQAAIFNHCLKCFNRFVKFKHICWLSASEGGGMIATPFTFFYSSMWKYKVNIIKFL